MEDKKETNQGLGNICTHKMVVHLITTVKPSKPEHKFKPFISLRGALIFAKDGEKISSKNSCSITLMFNADSQAGLLLDKYQKEHDINFAVIEYSLIEAKAITTDKGVQLPQLKGVGLKVKLLRAGGANVYPKQSNANVEPRSFEDGHATSSPDKSLEKAVDSDFT